MKWEQRFIGYVLAIGVGYWAKLNLNEIREQKWRKENMSQGFDSQVQGIEKEKEKEQKR